MPLRDYQLRPYLVYLISDHTECELCTWVWAPSMGEPGKPFVLKFVNRQCRLHGKDLPIS